MGGSRGQACCLWQGPQLTSRSVLITRLLVSLHFVSQTLPDTSSAISACGVTISTGPFLCCPRPSASLSQALFARFLEDALCIWWVSVETDYLISLFLPFPLLLFILSCFFRDSLWSQLLWCGPDYTCIFSQHSIGHSGHRHVSMPIVHHHPRFSAYPETASMHIPRAVERAAMGGPHLGCVCVTPAPSVFGCQFVRAQFPIQPPSHYYLLCGGSSVDV